MKRMVLMASLAWIAPLWAHGGPLVSGNDRPARTPVQELVDAAGTGDATTVRRLLGAGVDIDAATPRTGATALHQAAANGHLSLVRMLVERGAAVDARDQDGATPLVYAAYHGRAPVVAALLAAGAAVDVRPHRQVHALNAAMMSGSREVVGILVDAGADPGLDDAFGHDARELARRMGRTDLQDTLGEKP
jgi:hypothetical protein